MAPIISVSSASSTCWDTVCTKVNRAVVFIDNVSAECLHWNRGAARLFLSGALDVKQFSSFEAADNSQKKGVFILSDPIHGVTSNILKDIIEASNFQYVIVITSAGPLMHFFVKHGHTEGDEQTVFHLLEEQVLEWMGNMNYSAEVTHIPLVAASVTSGLFLTPGFSSLRPLLRSEVKAIQLQYNTGRFAMGDRKNFGSLADVEFIHLPQPLQIKIKGLVSALNSLLEQLQVSEELYCLGQTSRIIAAELSNFPAARNRKKNAQNRASLLLVDRTLDLANVAGHHSETLLDKILSLLPRLPLQHNDVAVEMSGVCASLSRGSTVAPGCLAHRDDTSHSLINTMATQKHKEAMLDVNRRMVEAATAEGLPLKLSSKPGRVTANQINSHLSLFKGKSKAIRNWSGLLQIAMATVEALQHKKSGKLEEILGVEKGLLQSVGDEDGERGCLQQILLLLQTEMEKPHTERRVNLDDILSLLMFLYSLAPEECASNPDIEARIESWFAKALVAENIDDLPNHLRDLVEDSGSDQGVYEKVHEVFEKLNSIGEARDDLQQFSSLYESDRLTGQVSLKPLLSQVVEVICDPAKPQLTDVEHKSSGFKDLLKSGFGLFMNVSKPRPSDHPLLIIYVVGGVSAMEVRQVKEAVGKAKSDLKIVLGGTRLLQPADTVELLMSSPVQSTL